MIKNILDPDIEERWREGNANIWLYSDPHFSDLDSYRWRHLVKVMDKRDWCLKNPNVDPNDYDSYVKQELDKADTEQIKKINSKAGKNDTLIILGDVGNIECVKRLRARRKILILGNHDKGASNYKRIIKIEEAINHETGVIISRELIFDNHLFDEVYEGFKSISDRIILSHEPIIPIPEYMFNIHGHVHDKNNKGDERHLNVCAESIDYTPISLVKLIKDGLVSKVPNIHRPTIDKRQKGKK